MCILLAFILGCVAQIVSAAETQDKQAVNISFFFSVFISFK